MKNILITGGSGFLGRQIQAEAEKTGYRVFAPRSREFNLETAAGVDQYFEEIRNDPVDCVVHSAAYYGGIGINQKDPVGLMNRNTKMAINVFEAAQKWGVKKIISVGSACGYPGHTTDELKEENMFDGRCHDSVEAYGFTKRVHLVLQKAYFKQFGMLSNQIALTNLYGEHDVFNEKRSHVISALIKKVVDAYQNDSTVNAWGTGKPIREFLYVQNAAEVIVKSIEFEHDLEPINANGEEISIYDLSNLIAETVGLDKSKIQWDSGKPDGVSRKVLSGEKLKKLLPNYQPISLKEGLQKTISWYIDNKQEADQRK